MYLKHDDYYINLEENTPDPNNMPDAAENSQANTNANAGNNPPQNQPQANNNANSNDPMTQSIQATNNDQGGENQESDDPFDISPDDMGLSGAGDLKDLDMVTLLILPDINERFTKVSNIFNKMSLGFKHPLYKKYRMLRKIFIFFIDNFDKYSDKSTKLIKLFNLALLKLTKELVNYKNNNKGSDY